MSLTAATTEQLCFLFTSCSEARCELLLRTGPDPTTGEFRPRWFGLIAFTSLLLTISISQAGDRSEFNAVTVHPGEQRQIFYRVVNKTTQPVTASATFNVTPAKSGIYFDKLQCFCFSEQHLEPGESAETTLPRRSASD